VILKWNWWRVGVEVRRRRRRRRRRRALFAIRNTQTAEGEES